MKIKKNKSAFLDYVGDTPQLRILDFFIGNYFFDFPLTEIARESEVSYNSLKALLPKLLEKDILIVSRKIGKSDYYKLNIESQFVKNIIKLAWQLTKQDVLGETPNSDSEKSNKKKFIEGIC
ncbi:hypothetical protein K9L16_02835 [Candidatus Pacearchaeota archaeon]|nr:hypothetical protein [Candidatus Pacearchaeota archaeon]